MAKSTTKCKVEGPLPDAGSAKLRKMSVETCRGIASEVSSEGGKSGPSAGPENPSQDLLPEENQGFLDLIKYSIRNKESSKRANKYLEEFKKTLQMQERGLSSTLDEEEAQYLAQNAKYLDTVRIIYAPSNQNGVIGETRNRPSVVISDRPTHNLYHESMVVVGRALDLIGLFQEPSTKIARNETAESMNKRWDNDLQDMRQILDTGRCVGEWQVESILNASHGELLNADAIRTSELLSMRTNGHKNDVNWAGVARNHEKAIIRLVTTLPRLPRE